MSNQTSDHMNNIIRSTLFAASLLTACNAMGKAPKVYLDTEHKRVHKTSIDRMQKLGWDVVTNRADADFVLHIDVKWIPILGDRRARAYFIDPHSNDTLFATKRVTTLSTVTFVPRKTVVKRLFKKRIQAVIPMEMKTEDS